uniref:Uncharacterized protein AlNc14C373G11126 n=1 Tax=Albugo laibachii Nc14 TaxID=890382 RepID=F0WY66_9STRA|nr:conserved hypothetical protein [Albugo laibachii Nc14]|eukprot:CCA26418.1 conserved hypothetical protein [Albugo laibachii Nc14]
MHRFLAYNETFRFDDIQAILICTWEGVPLVHVVEPERSSGSYEAAETLLPTILARAADQVGKLRFGAVKNVTAYYKNTVLIHVNDMPLVITIIAIRSPQSAVMYLLGEQLREALSPLRKCIESADVQLA